ncbi:hypothetical protein [Paenibacillus alba]|uniref:Uncharacterized protein n=1 Tax=Paenibacillus alba TaxID=1197127 RepID=A0ABU6G1R2_9BACL|nr:hypothetical protein [Paenibacillus alba]MEC0227911.1 hypothetical protein [Paenibacillus alba]
MNSIDHWVDGKYEIILQDLQNDVYDITLGEIGKPETVETIERFVHKETAIRVMNVFSRNFADAIQRGYELTLSSRNFLHSDGRKVHISNSLEIDFNQEQFIALLEEGEFVA